MTSEEAINLLSQMRKDGEGFLSDNTIEAYDMAIKALEQEPKTGWIPVSKKLPGMGKSVLVTDDGDEYFKENGLGWVGKANTFAYVTENGWELPDRHIYDIQLNKITARQLLPESYEESEG